MLETVGPVLCKKHARQVAGLGQQPVGPCEPNSHWLNGRGEQITCDVIESPERIDAYFETQRERARTNRHG